jgi:LPS export ABC transporter protein LptC
MQPSNGLSSERVDLKIESKQIKWGLLAVISLTMGALVWSFMAHRRNMEAPRASVDNLDTGADMRLGNVHQTATRDGVKEWDLVAASAKYDEAKNQVEFEEVSAVFFLKDNQEVSLNAKRGVLEPGSRDIAVSGGVTVENRGYKLETEALTYDHGNRTIVSQAPVVISGRTFRLAGNRLFLNLDAQEAELEGKVTGSFSDDITL